jgi:two-component system cell cycle response regulator
MVDARDALDTLLELTRALRGERPLEEALGEVTRAAVRLLHANHASLRLLDETGEHLLASVRFGAGADLPPLRFLRGEGIIGWVVEHGEPVLLDDARNDVRFKRKLVRQGFVVGSLVAVPMLAGGRVFGVLSASSERTGAFSEEDSQLLQLLANCSVPPIEKARLERLAVIDPHTLAFRQTYLLPRLEEEMGRSTRYAAPLSILFMDLDHFKNVNDSHGHAVGDRVLRSFADRVRQSVRLSDLLVRRGGEEFVLVLPNMPLDGATAAAERIRASIESEPFATGPDMTVSQTVSIGVAEWNGTESAAKLEERADSAMYAAKEQGRNRVCVSTPRPIR